MLLSKAQDNHWASRASLRKTSGSVLLKGLNGPLTQIDEGFDDKKIMMVQYSLPEQ
jgi:hypothetical protein